MYKGGEIKRIPISAESLDNSQEVHVIRSFVRGDPGAMYIQAYTFNLVLLASIAARVVNLNCFENLKFIPYKTLLDSCYMPEGAYLLFKKLITKIFSKNGKYHHPLLNKPGPTWNKTFLYKE